MSATGIVPIETPSPRRTAAALDWLERGTILLLYSWLVFRLVSAAVADATWGNLMLLPSEGLVLLFILIRRTTDDVSRRPWHWCLALAGTAAPMLVQSTSGAAMLPPLVGAVLILMGMLVQMHAKIVLGRSMGCVPANRGLKFAGPYRCLRHPMYAGYLLTHLAFLLMNPVIWNVALYTICFGLQVARIEIEERLLSRDPRYLEYAATVRYRLVPGLY